MATIIKPPTRHGPPSIFLAGSIEMGTAEDWQTQIEEALKDKDVVIFNPRRDDWDSSWEQTLENANFYEQVQWELSALERADIIIMYFSPGTKSPISLLEFGLFARTGKLLVCCPPGFWRKGNVDIVCEKYNIMRFGSLKNLIATLVRSV